MPYSSVSDVSDYVPKGKRRQWLAVFNSAYKSAKKDGKSDKDAESSAFAQANTVAGPNAKAIGSPFVKVDGGWRDSDRFIKAAGTSATGFVRAIEGPFRCGHCRFMTKEANKSGICTQKEVNDDPELKDEPRDVDGYLLVSGGDCSNEYEPVTVASAEKVKTMKPKFKKFIPFIKVDAAKREVWGVVTAEVPDKDDEVCDYAGSKPFYEAVIAEMSKATDGKNFFPLREMHQLSAVGKGVGFEFRDEDKEIFMGFKVVDDDAWKKVDEGVYTGFSQGGVIVGDMTPDPTYKGCKRYTANPSEVSLVDNPCLGVAHFTYVKADNTIELRKFKKTEDAVMVPTTRLDQWAKAVEKLARQHEGQASPATDVRTLEKKKKEAVRKLLEGARVVARVWYHKKCRAAKTVIVMPNELARLDSDLGYLTRKQPLAKGLYTVGRLAEYIEGLSYMLCGIVSEEEWEGEESSVPGLLAENVNSLLDTFLAYAEEEAEELRQEVASKV